MAHNTLPARSEIKKEETWNLESIYPELESWQQARQELEKTLPELESFQGRLAESPGQLIGGLKLREKVIRQARQVGMYAMLDSAVDMTHQEKLARSGQGQSLMSRTAAAVSFFEPEIMSLGMETLEGWMEKEPDLAEYGHYFEDLERQKQHVRSAEVEEVLALSSDPLSAVPAAYGALTNADLEFKPAVAEDGSDKEIGQSSIDALKTDPDRGIRRTAWEHYADGYLAHKNSIAAIQVGAFKRDVFRAKAHRFDSSLQASLFPVNVPLQVFHNLMEVFRENLPTWHRYWRIRRKILGYEELRVSDIKAPLTEKKPEVPYQQAVDWICEGMEPLGEDYVRVLRRGCGEARWVDRSLNKGKRQGAFSAGSYDTQPFIMMSYRDDVFSLSTLAHELGHSMHSYYTRKNQPFINSDYSLFVAEVASNFNQAMVRDYLFRTQQDSGFQLALIEETMANFHRYFFIMPTLARFELEMHQRVERGEPVNAARMIELCAELFQEGYGGEVAFDRDRIGITWAQFGHLYANFYVYQYATGISGAQALVDRVLKNGAPAAEQYLDFLKAGSSVYPLDALKTAGVDLTHPEPIEKAFASLAKVVDRLEELAL
ncbi:MAG: oligoendopeptidase F [Anaerolineales bacterium]|nr:oligoendopeptidase F [Anaerolineales bacterium]